MFLRLHNSTHSKMMRGPPWRMDYAGIVCVVVLLAENCVCDTERQEEIPDKRELEEYYKKGHFMLESSDQHKCINVGESTLRLEDCERPTQHMLWKWVSRQQLFNLGTGQCLGLKVNTSYPLGMFECDTSYSLMWWRCQDNGMLGPFIWRLTVSGDTVTAKKSSYHNWKRYGSHNEGPCAFPYEEVYTLLGNSHGKPCTFPFKYNSKWFTECTTEGREDHLPWCATSTHYDQDQRWGFCPVDDLTCDTFWESNAELQACYQFNLHTILTWSQALSSCQAQGGNLLSITSLSEARYIRDRLASVGVRVWIGLNHIKDSQGWHWSDGSPLTFVNFTSALPAKPMQVTSECGVYNPANAEQWQGMACLSALPYICKKTPNNTQKAEPLENWQYIPTDCDNGWLAHNGHCYRVTAEAENWHQSRQSCVDQGANLTSLHSLSEVEFLVNVLHNFTGSSSEVWLGLWKQESSPAVEWFDGSPVTLAPWHQNQPPHIPPTDGSLCGTADVKEGDWFLRSCYLQYPGICRKKGRTAVPSSESWDEGCPEGWKRHGHHCYTVTSYEHNSDDAVTDYYCKGSLLTVENKFEQAFVNSLLREKGANSSVFYWIGLRDQEDRRGYRWIAHNNTEVPLTFTNWNKHQPVSVGGCVAMSGGPALGHWEVKHCQTFKALSVCKRSIENYQDAPLPEDHKAAYAPCPPGWESQPGMLHCFKVFHDEKVLMKRSWMEADFFCQALGAKLASFQFYEEQLFVKHLLSTMFEETEARWFWMGLNKRDPENPSSWQWSDDSPVVTSFIKDKNSESIGDCAVFSHATNSFAAKPCDRKYEWICKMLKGAHLLKPYWYTEQSEPWVFFRGAEYLLAKQPFNWDAVSLACQMMGSYLLSIHSREELHFIKERLRRYSLGPTEWWIGLSIGPPGTETRWTDGTELEFQNWSEGILHVQITGMCVTVSSSTGKWSVSQCSDLHGYVCKRRTLSVLETPREPHYIGACPDKWLYYGHKCLLLHLPEVPEDGKTWTDAESICSSFGGTLVAIENEIEQAYITMLLQGSSVGVWIGLQNDDTSAWTSGKAVTYTNWSPVEPKSHLTINEYEWLHGFEPELEPLCVVMSNNHNFHLTGKWYDEKCSTSGYGFVCQKPQDTSKHPTHSYRPPSAHEKIEYRDHNYRVLSGNMSWYEAMQSCSESGSELVSVTDPYHQAFLTVLVNRLVAPHWIGLYSRDSGINYQWSDGSDMVYTHWDSTEDEDDFLTGDCVYMDENGGWRRADCESTLPGALCHVPELITKAMSTSEVACPSTWVKFKSVCYSFEPVVQRLPLEEARDHCRQKLNTSDVLTIETETENLFILEQLWSLGFVHQAVWLGMFFNADTESLNWVDGSPVDYTNWPSRPPDHSQLSTDTCVSTKAADGVWYLTQCHQKLGFVCKTTTYKDIEVEAEPLNGLHHGVIAAAVLVAVVVFALLVGAFCLVYKRREGHLRRIGSAYYRQTSSHSDGNVLITDLETRSGE
ncbi:secretory phospholipase A2 receptor [Eucyclogobius newberryi]|uniref:secretory phospholipase A2 receptor n=1 Tax=Eucyclogobius newberryi TaxID=166745 RepID=UPI003B592036